MRPAAQPRQAVEGDEGLVAGACGGLGGDGAHDAAHRSIRAKRRLHHGGEPSTDRSAASVGDGMTSAPQEMSSISVTIDLSGPLPHNLLLPGSRLIMGASEGSDEDRGLIGRIPAVDLAAAHADLKEEIDAAVQHVLASGRFIGGPEVEALEREFAAFCDVPHAVAVASGTDALRFALMTTGTGAGSEVITSPPTFIATTGGISQAR